MTKCNDCKYFKSKWMENFKETFYFCTHTKKRKDSGFFCSLKEKI